MIDLVRPLYIGLVMVVMVLVIGAIFGFGIGGALLWGLYSFVLVLLGSSVGHSRLG